MKEFFTNGTPVVLSPGAASLALIARHSQETTGEDDADRGSDMGDCMGLDCMDFFDDDFVDGQHILSDVA